jgi:glycerophosphoryl diester phosphodiesterase
MRVRLTILAVALSLALAVAQGVGNGGVPSMLDGNGGWTAKPIFTIGETIDNTTGDLNSSTAGKYTPVGVLDGLGAYELDRDTVRVFANHELLNFRGNEYEVGDGQGDTFSLIGARVSYFDIDKDSLAIVDAGLAYNHIYDANGDVAEDDGFLSNDFAGLSRLCSAGLFEASQFGRGRGLRNRIFFTGEEDGGFFNGVGGAEWALDPETGNLWQLPALGRGAWENVTVVDTGSSEYVAIVLADDSSPFDFTGDGVAEGVPLYLYVGKKQSSGDFPTRNGLRGGKLFVWVPDDKSVDSPAEFHGSGSLAGRFVEIDNGRSPDAGDRSEDGSTGYDEYGFPTQSNLVTQARNKGAFQFSRPEDVATNPADGSEFVLASTGVDTFDIDPKTGNGVDTFGTMYTMKIDFSDLDNPKGDLVILYDGDADEDRKLRSPDNLDWADDGVIYVQEDKAEDDTASGDEVLFGDGAANPNEAGIVAINRKLDGQGNLRGVQLQRVANIDRTVVLDGSIGNSANAIDRDAGVAGEWESSGILDVSKLFGRSAGTLFLVTVQAHGIVDQESGSPGNNNSRIEDDDLVEGGQLLFLARNRGALNGNGR